jgi:hypothetical protein
MKRSWECAQIEVIHVRTSSEKYEQALDEFTKLIYDSFCQLDENQFEAPQTLSTRLRESEDADVA